MTEAALAVVIIALLVERFWTARETSRKERRLLNLIAAKTPQDFAILNRIEDPPKPPKPPVPAGETQIPVGL